MEEALAHFLFWGNVFGIPLVALHIYDRHKNNQPVERNPWPHDRPRPEWVSQTPPRRAKP